MIKEVFQNNPRIKWLLVAGFVIQLITCITAIGVSNTDQHFQVIEFSLYQLGKPNGAAHLWEMQHFVRPTLQVYLFSGYHLFCNYLSLTDPYLQLTILRVILGIIMFVVFNLMAIHFFKNNIRILTFVLLLLNFSWCLPYTRTLFNSEMMSSLFFFGTLLLFDYKNEKTIRPGMLLLIGFLFGIAFYFRFQIGFALSGFGLWMIFFQKKYQYIVPLGAGFLVAVLINVFLDYGYYHEWIFTPYHYFAANIIDGRAESFGTSSFFRYIGLILLVAPFPPLSFLLIYFSFNSFTRIIKNPVFISVTLFVLAHSLVGHKEDRFIFPVFNAFPILIGWGMPGLERWYTSRKWIKYIIKTIVVFSVAINITVLLFLTFVPYSQTIQFSYLLKQKFDNKPVVLYCLGQAPFETPSGNPFVFYKNGAKNITQERITNLDTIGVVSNGDVYVSTTYNDIKNDKNLIKKLRLKPAMHSSDLLWKVNEFLDANGINTINEIWVLYKKED